MGKAKFYLDEAYLKELLNMPNDTIFLFVGREPEDIANQRILFVAEHPDLPEHEWGQCLLRVSPQRVSRIDSLCNEYTEWIWRSEDNL